jgi:hypothetical protein
MRCGEMKNADHVDVVNSRIILKLILRIYGVCWDLNQRAQNSDHGRSVGESVTLS